MFTILTIMFVGITLGYLFRKKAILQKFSKPISYTICLLLFFLGISVGSNNEIIRNLPSLGGLSFLLAFAGTLGSVLVAKLIYKLFFEKE
jgi:uncharacterized membrane protein YbjE (DUF340 family)